MPVKVVKRGDKYRIVEAETEELAENRHGQPVDGGGHDNEAKAERQAAAINANT